MTTGFSSHHIFPYIRFARSFLFCLSKPAACARVTALGAFATGSSLLCVSVRLRFVTGFFAVPESVCAGGGPWGEDKAGVPFRADNERAGDAGGERGAGELCAAIQGISESLDASQVEACELMGFRWFQMAGASSIDSWLRNHRCTVGSEYCAAKTLTKPTAEATMKPKSPGILNSSPSLYVALARKSHNVLQSAAS